MVLRGGSERQAIEAAGRRIVPDQTCVPELMRDLALSIYIGFVRTSGPVVLAIFLAGCGDARNADGSKPALSASASVTNVDGQLSKQTPSTQDLERLKVLDAKLAAIDAEYPPPHFDPKAELHRVAEVRPDGVILLQGGVALRPDGIHCSAAGIANMSKMLLDDTARVAFKVSPDGDSPMPAEIWLADVSAQQWPRYSMIAETALTSGWCEPQKTATTKLYPRYVALAALAPGESK